MKMFDAWLKGKFYSKCKAAIKLTKARIDLIQRKKNAMQKYLRNDIADFLKNDLETNAFGRCEDLLIELHHSRCYDLMEQYCQQISSNLSTMCKERECPEDCKEAVSTLMFAAARFGDVPELRYLRTIFAERYGNSLDFFVNKEFVEKVKLERPCKDTKLQLMQDIASEYGIEWNSKALEQKLYNPPATQQDSLMYGNDHKLDDKAQKKGHRTPERENDSDNQSVVPFYNKPPYTKSREEKMKGNDGKDARPKPKSVRSKRNSNRSREDVKTSTDEESDEIEEMKRLDTLLAHYSAKKSAGGKKPDTEPKASPVQDEASSSRIPRRRSLDCPPTRASSLPVETQQRSSPTQTPKAHFRSASCHAETWNPKGHVHPKLPDYDDLVARLAAARASMKD